MTTERDRQNPLSSDARLTGRFNITFSVVVFVAKGPGAPGKGDVVRRTGSEGSFSLRFRLSRLVVFNMLHAAGQWDMLRVAFACALM